MKTVYTYDLDGSTRDFPVPFEYLARKFVQVTLLGTSRRPLVLNVDYRFTQRTVITTTVAWGVGEGYNRIEIKRVTSATERLVDFNDGSVLRAYDLNTAQVQSLHISEEGRDIATDTIGLDANGDLDARGRKLVNLADAVDPGDAVTFRQEQAWAQSTLGNAQAAAAAAAAAQQSNVDAYAAYQASNGAAANSAQASQSAQLAASAAAGSASAAQNSNIEAHANYQGSLQNATEAKAAADRAWEAPALIEGSVTKAEQWAQNPRNIVIPGEPAGSFSAKHWAEVSRDSIARFEREVSPINHGAKWDGVTDDTVAIQAALAEAIAIGGTLVLPAGSGVCSTTLDVTNRCPIRGQGRGTTKLIYTGVGDGVRWTAPNPVVGQNRYWVLSGFEILCTNPAQTGWPFRPWLRQGTYLSNWEIEFMEFTSLAGKQGVFFDNSVKNLDGFFASMMRRCWVSNGILGQNMGDSMNFETMTITGANTGIDFTCLAGARQLIVRECNITTTGGAFSFWGAEQARFINNQLEHPGYQSGYTGDKNAFIWMHDCFKCLFEGNTMNPDNRVAGNPNGYQIALVNTVLDGTTSYIRFVDNDWQKGGAYHLVTDTNTSKTLYEESNVTYGFVPLVKSIQGTGHVIREPY